MGKTLTLEQVKNFIESNSNCKLLSDSYQNNRDQLEFLCGCGNRFRTSYSKFAGQNKRQCNGCGKILNNLSKTTIIEEVREFVKTNSDCRLLSTSYKNNRSNLKFKCSCGEIFYARFDNFKNQDSRYCSKCLRERKLNRHRDNFINEMAEYTRDNTDCELVSTSFVDAKSGKLTFRCQCGELFDVNWNNFKNGYKRQCNSCANVHSHGEKRIELFLNEKNIKYIPEYRFNDCRHRRALPFDFYLPKTNTCIEYDGEFHYKETSISNLKVQKLRDKIKDKYCKENNINLIRIPYYEFNDIEKILESQIY